MAKRSILLIISGSIAAYKSLELIRRGQERGYDFTTILTKGGEAFITPLSAASLSGTPCYTDLFSLKDETEMGHIRLSREADLILVAPASADLLAKVVHGQCDDLASTVLLATNKPVAIAPAMNHRMWEHPATQRNISQLQDDGVLLIEPDSGVQACGEEGAGRMAEPEAILNYLDQYFTGNKHLSGMKVLVTAGPTYESIDPVRFIANRSSGKQGYAIAAALANAGADVTLVSGPTALTAPDGVTRIDVESAGEMLDASLGTLPTDIAICTAAVADWRIDRIHENKMKKSSDLPSLSLVENPDILKQIAAHPNRPDLVIGFAAETESLESYAKEKLLHKGCDWIIANDVSDNKAFARDDNEIILITRESSESLERMSKQAIASEIVARILSHFDEPKQSNKESSHG